MDIPKSPFKSLTEKAENYTNISIEILKQKAIEKSSFLFSKIIVSLIISVIFTLILILISIGISLWVGDLLGMPCLGFFIVSALLGIFAFTIYRSQKQLVSNQLTKMFLFIFDSTKI